MRQIRCGTFETNSSSTHSMVIAMKDEFDKWENGEYILHNYDDEFITKEEAMELYQEAKDGDETFPPFEDWINTWDAELWDYQHWIEDEYLETDFHTFTTPGGETIAMVCKYGQEY